MSDNDPNTEDDFRRRIEAEKAKQLEEQNTAEEEQPDYEDKKVPDIPLDPFKQEEEMRRKMREEEARKAEEATKTPEDEVLSGYVDLRKITDEVNASVDTLETVINDTLMSMDDDTKTTILSDGNHPLTQMIRSLNTARTTRQAQMMITALKEAKELGQELRQTFDQDFKDKTSKGGGYHGELIGTNAAVAFRARTQGLKKVYLYNSGFHVVIRPFTIAELNEFFTTCDQEHKELGHILGGHFYLIHSMFIKKRFMELFPLAVISSNLKRWREDNVLAKHISLQDYDTLLWAVCSLMYKKGIQHNLICSNSECNHITTNLTMDLDKMRLANMSRMPESAIAFMMDEKENVTTKELEKYRNELLEFEYSFTHKNIRYDLKIPSIYDYLNYTKKLMDVIASKVQGPNSIMNNTILTNVIINYNRNFVPWLKRISYMDGDKVSFSSTTVDAFHSVLDDLGRDDEDDIINKEFSKFMRSSKISFIGYHTNKCEKCSQESEDSVDNFKAFDVEHLFFSLSYRKLEPVGIA